MPASLAIQPMEPTMPSVQDWRTTPLMHVNKVFQQEVASRAEGEANSDETWTSTIYSFFKDNVSKGLSGIPSLNTTPIHHMLDGQLVTFRCMIQDMFDPEYYYSEYSVRDLSTGQLRRACGRFRDFADLASREEIVEGTSVNADRLMFYCVNVPAEAPWAQDAYRRLQPDAPAIDRKRRHDTGCSSDAENASSGANVSMDVDEDSGSKKSKDGGSGGAKAAPPPASGGNRTVSLNLPIAGSKGQAAIVKIYDVPEGTFSVNDVVEFVGVISLNPLLAQIPLEGTDDVFAQFERKEMETKNPPASLVPRLHVLHHTKLASYANPLLPRQLDLTQAMRSEAAACRQQLRGCLTKLLLGDSLAADYLICHLVSRVYHRRDVLCLGKFSLNLFNVPTAGNYTKRLATIIQLLTTKSHYLPMSVDTFNKGSFVPRKDYHENRLVSGLLQLSAGTHLILDETTMADGQLTADGLRNVTAIGNVISWQKLEYDFNYHRIEFETDIAALVVSEGRTMFQAVDAQVMLKPEVTDAGHDALVIDREMSDVGREFVANTDVLDKIRRYLSVVKQLDYDLSDEMQKSVQEDFVNERRRPGGEQMTTDDLHAYLVLARLIGTSRGDASLTPEVWAETKDMERRRRERVAHLPPQQRPAQQQQQQPQRPPQN